MDTLYFQPVTVENSNLDSLTIQELIPQFCPLHKHQDDIFLISSLPFFSPVWDSGQGHKSAAKLQQVRFLYGLPSVWISSKITSVKMSMRGGAYRKYRSQGSVWMTQKSLLSVWYMQVLGAVCGNRSVLLWEIVYGSVYASTGGNSIGVVG